MIMLKETDAVVIGVGWTGSILARELTKAGLNVVGLERGAKRMPGENFTIPSVRDDLKSVSYTHLARVMAKRGSVSVFSMAARSSQRTPRTCSA